MCRNGAKRARQTNAKWPFIIIAFLLLSAVGGVIMHFCVNFASIVQLHAAVVFSGWLSYFLCVLHIVNEGERAHVERCTFSKANGVFPLQNEKVFAFYFVVFQCTDDGLFSTTQLINYVCGICNFFATAATVVCSFDFFLLLFPSFSLNWCNRPNMQRAVWAIRYFHFKLTQTHKNQISLIDPLDLL